MDNQSSLLGRACFSVDQFCSSHAISRAMLYKLWSEGRGPRVMTVGSRRLISQEAAADWRRECESASAA